MEFDKEILAKIDKALLEEVNKEGILYEASKHLVMAGGKRIRPYLSVLTFLLKKDISQIDEVIQPAISVELIHNYSLIHDDIMDNDDERRGKPTVHKIYGIPIAILAGDLLNTMAFNVISKVENPEKSKELLKIVSEGSIKVCEGQTEDMEFEKMNNEEIPTEEQYYSMIGKKTGALIETAISIGAIMGDFTEEERKAINEYAKRIGLTFQIQDDVLDLIGDKNTIGKPVGSDIIGGKKTIIILHALKTLSENKKQRLLEILGNDNANEEDVKEAIEILAPSIENAKNIMKKATSEAKDYLKIFDENKRKPLEDLAEFIIKRVF